MAHRLARKFPLQQPLVLAAFGIEDGREVSLGWAVGLGPRHLPSLAQAEPEG